MTQRSRRAGIAVLTIAAAILVAWAVLGPLAALLARSDSGFSDVPLSTQLDLLARARTQLLTLVLTISLVVLAAILARRFFAGRLADFAEQQHTKMIGRLGDPDPVVRMGALLVLDDLARHHPDHRARVRATAAGYLRTHTSGVRRDGPTVDLDAAFDAVTAHPAVNGENPPDLTGIVLTSFERPGLVLPRARLVKANLIKASLPKANLSGANLAGANLIGADLTEADLSGANLTGAELSSAILTRADLRNANLSSASLGSAQMAGALLSGANLERARFTSVDLSDTTGLTAEQLQRTIGDGQLWPHGLDSPQPTA